MSNQFTRSAWICVMQKSTLWSWCVALFWTLALTGCVATGEDVVAKYNQAPLSVRIPLGVSPEEVEESIVRSLEGREWHVVSRSPEEVVGTLDHRSYQAKVILKVNQNVIKITNQSRYKSEPAVPEKWLENLQADLNKSFNGPASSG